MYIREANPTAAKGWYLGPWNSALGLSIGYANQGIDEPHFHKTITEVYLMAQGSAEMRVEQETLVLHKGQVIVIEPGEAHTFLSSSADHFHFVIQFPGLEGEDAHADKVTIPRSRIAL